MLKIESSVFDIDVKIGEIKKIRQVGDYSLCIRVYGLKDNILSFDFVYKLNDEIVNGLNAVEGFVNISELGIIIHEEVKYLKLLWQRNHGE